MPTAKIYIFYTNWVPYDNRNRFKTKINAFFPSNVPHEVIEMDGNSSEAQIKLSYLTIPLDGTPKIPCYLVDLDNGNFMVASNRGKSMSDGYLFPEDSNFKEDFKVVEDAYKRLDSGKNPTDVYNDIKDELKKEEAKKPASPVDQLVHLGKNVGIGLVCCAVGFGYLYYKAHQTNVNINLQQ
ncbi:MAG: hypothetical protein RIS64_3781 [Bacteroidota bacterium]|jgi:hypothetical protein